MSKWLERQGPPARAAIEIISTALPGIWLAIGHLKRQDVPYVINPSSCRDQQSSDGCVRPFASALFSLIADEIGSDKPIVDGVASSSAEPARVHWPALGPNYSPDHRI
jgi:hypothetical protein